MRNSKSSSIKDKPAPFCRGGCFFSDNDESDDSDDEDKEKDTNNNNKNEFCPTSEWELVFYDNNKNSKMDQKKYTKHLMFFHFCPGGPLTNSSGSTSMGSSKSGGSKKGDHHHHHSSEGGQVDDTWYSIFPVETPELVYGRWEDEVIWSVEEVKEVPEPKILALDPNDENIILCIPGE